MIATPSPLPHRSLPPMSRRRERPQRAAINPAVEARLWNWGRAVRDPGPRRQHCASVEWKFSLPRFRAMDLEAAGVRASEIAEILGRDPQEPIDYPDAWRVELAVTGFQMPAPVLALLRAYYVYCAMPNATARVLKFPPTRFNERLAEAVRMAETAIRIVDLRNGVA